MSAVAILEQPLVQCVACLVAETPTQHHTLRTIAERTAFSACWPASERLFPADDDRRMPFFLFHCGVNGMLLRDTLARIRTSEQYRFSPAILVAGDCSAEDISRYIALGFDDIVNLPGAAGAIEKRLARQLGTPLHYFETATYFGPDRRRTQRTGPTSKTRPGEFRFIRYVIERSATSVDIKRREVLLASNPPLPSRIAPMAVSATA